MQEQLQNMLENFYKETWSWQNDSAEFDNDIMYFYKIEKELNENKDLENKLPLLIKIMRFKYGKESQVFKNIPKLKQYYDYISNFSLESSIDTLEEVINFFTNILNECIKEENIIDMPILKEGEEGLYLAQLSLKTLLENREYNCLLKDEEKIDILLDYFFLKNNPNKLNSLERKYNQIIKMIWEKTLGKKENSFSFLFSNISGGNLEMQINNLRNREGQSSVSLITSNFIATYGTNWRRIGFVYPNDANILMASAWDLGSNVFGLGVKNKEKATTLITPSALELTGLKRAHNAKESPLFSSKYSEILVESKPVGMMIIGFGEKDLNIDYDEVYTLANNLNLPVEEIDLLEYESSLNETDKEYIAYHTLMSYFGLKNSDIYSQNDNSMYLFIMNLIKKYKDIIANHFIELKNNKMLSKDNMNLVMTDYLKTVNLPKKENNLQMG